MAIVGAADDSVPGDAGAHHHHAADRPVVLAVAAVVSGRSAKVRTHHDRDLIGDAHALRRVHREVRAVHEVDEIGQVVGQGIMDDGTRRAFLLTPVPIPPTFWLFGSALGLLGWMRRKSA